jgi:DNA polymerase-4/DNA polymerase V
MSSIKTSLISVSSYPRAILHVDGDAFFASVEQAVNPNYKGKPLVSGSERGIIAAASYEAKALGIKRGLSIQEARKICPKLIVVPTDYETCGLYSKNMMNIIKSFSPLVEEYSIDEAFADITGLRRIYRCSYKEIAKQVQDKIKKELDINVSVGLSLSKSLAKIASDFRKPQGLVCVPGKYIHILLAKTKVEEVWGIGPNTTGLLKQHNIYTALDFVNSDVNFIKRLLGKLGTEKWQELRGEYIYKINPERKTLYQSVSKARTFSPTTRKKEVLKAFLLRNLESACIKIRRHNLQARKIYISIKNQSFEYRSTGVKLNRTTANTFDLIPIVSQLFEKIYVPDEYRASSVVLADLAYKTNQQNSLFDDTVKIEKIEKLSECIDVLNNRFGKHTVHTAGSLNASQQHIGKKGTETRRKQTLLKGENKRQRLKIPMSFIKI